MGVLTCTVQIKLQIIRKNNFTNSEKKLWRHKGIFEMNTVEMYRRKINDRESEELGGKKS